MIMGAGTLSHRLPVIRLRPSGTGIVCMRLGRRGQPLHVAVIYDNITKIVIYNNITKKNCECSRHTLGLAMIAATGIKSMP